MCCGRLLKFYTLRLTKQQEKPLLYISPFLSERVRVRATTRETPIKFFSLRSACLCKLMLVTSRRAKVTCGEP